ncbi:uncharacterized protein LOC110035521 isoform X2 [Phalaenopsis equestris]|uniref:uncharacterized protein LOC110035521 isoform X2 n=1 Tax=Phalaenopsis equestris TaxID=78828 RepID=UPI0009E4547A|nr:uncharacterized protein LOC110035521 isoform X2 [Phalaenopsis equestris]XP_020595415.1 uncharacterized protein LOC110035521 isoform X2 [Phalaenopsis equestris]
MATYRIAFVIMRSSGEEFLLVRQTPPPSFEDDDYLRFVDSKLWDLPSAPLKPLAKPHPSKEVIFGIDSLLDKLDLTTFDVDSALSQISSQLGRATPISRDWSVLKYVEEADFGPDSPIKTLFIVGKLIHEDEDLSDSCKFISKESAAKIHLQSTPGGDRIGLLTIIGLLHRDDKSQKPLLPRSFLNHSIQEYPLGLIVAPMKSRTQKPFSTTNLVLIVAEDETIESETNESAIFKHGEALLVDPGCSVQQHSDLEDLINALPRKLLVFLTHHHYDHIDGLSVIDKCNPDAILLAHPNTLRRINTTSWSHESLPISGGETLQIGRQKLEIVFAPGHTDGHAALLHLNSNSLIVGDHCVGHGSAVLDITSGGNMKDYFETTYNFLDLKPNVLIPMHGRVNLWPQNMLCGYLKHRRERELRILKAIEDGAETLFDIVAKVYADVSRSLWLAASSNVKLHVDHLAYQNMLPKGFSLENFNNSYDDFLKKISSL